MSVHRFFRWLALIIFPFAPQLIAGQQMPIYHFGVEEGLPQTTVRVIKQDRFGQIWIGTGGGLASFDGQQFRRYLPNAKGKEGLKEEYISDIAIHDSGTVYVLTPHALHRIEPGHRNISRIVEKEEKNYLSVFHSLSDSIAVVFNQNDFDRINLAEKQFGPPTQIASGAFYQVGNWIPYGSFLQPNDTLWKVGKSLQSEVVHLKRPLNGIGMLRVAGQDFLFGRGGIIEMAGEGSKLLDLHFEGKDIRAVVKLKSGGWAVAATGEGLYMCRDDFSVKSLIDQAYFRKYQQLWRFTEIKYLFEDRNENLWIGTNEEGLFCLPKRKTKFEWLNVAEGKLSGAMVRAIRASGDTLWVGTYLNGLTEHHLGSGNSRFHLPGKTVNSVWTRNGSLIAATEEGLFTRRGSVLEKLTWPGADEGCVQILDIPLTDSLMVLGRHYLYIIHPGGRGRKVSTSFQGAFRVEDHIFFKHNHFGIIPWNPGLSSPSEERLLQDHIVNDILVSQGHFLIATRKGILLLDKDWKLMRHITVADGLPDNFVYMLLEDEKKRIWLSTNRGMACIDPQRHSIRTYQPTDGIQSYEFNTRAAFKGQDGRMFFGGVNGVNHFLPEEIIDNPHAPEIILQDLTLGDKQFAFISQEESPAHFELPYGFHDLDASVSLIDFAHPERNHFSAWLEGLENTFKKQTAGTNLHYSSLGPGTYKLHVRATNADGVSGKEKVFLSFEILPPFWVRWWFITLAILIGSFFIALLARAWTRRKYEKRLRAAELHREIEKVRQRISQDMHDDLGAGLTKLAIMAERVQFDKANPSGFALDFGREVRTINEEMRNILSTVSPSYDTLPEFLAYIRNFAGAYLERVGLDYRFHFPKDVPRLFVHPDKRHAVISVIKESLNNIAKHSKATWAEVHVEIRGRNLHIMIKDNGIGIPEKMKTKGHGLKNMRERMHEQQGKFRIVTSEKGTEIHCELNLGLTQNGEGNGNQKLSDSQT